MGLATMFSKALKREKNMFGASNKRKKQENRHTAQKVSQGFQNARDREMNGYKELEEQIVGKRDIKKNVEMELEAQGAEMEQVQPCPEGCGRSFGTKALEKHIKVCKKVFQTKRKAFDTKKKRMLDREQELAMRKGERKMRSVSKENSMNKKWKKDSEKLRDIVSKKTAPKMKNKTTAQDFNLGDVICDFCGKEFNEKALSRHQPLCKIKSRNRKK